MVFTCFIQARFFHLHVFFLHASYRLPFFIYMFFFACFIQAPSFHLHVFLHVSFRPLFSFTCFFTCFIKAPFFHLHGFYMFHKGSLSSFTWFLQDFKHSVSRLFVAFDRIIYKLFTWFSKAIYMFFTTEDTVKEREKFYRFLHVLQIIIVKQDNVNQYLRNIYMLY